MRHTSATLALTAALLLAPAAPALAEAPTGQVTATAVSPTAANDTDKDKDDSSGGWGLWGLVGLLGLAGLIPRGKKNNRDVPPRPAPGGNPTTGSHPTDPRV
ncbi:WGxxGxxG family protein [Streptomyces sp. NRRL WC-3549]|uniref:WGxxGxxG family protein n=1 Tax=Streptomyces sp. NRRL WC-3549 TaxID=1463925 RepID=UPI0004C6F9F8|nr:WGxxGxxG family protein [Streptomyces sp. NRRL WC-3549]